MTGGDSAIFMGGVLTIALPPIPTLTNLNITFMADAHCNVLAYIAGGGITKNIINIDYTANNTQFTNAGITSTYLIKQPYLTITTVTNQSYTGNIGDVFTRCITVVNAGFGELSEFTLTDVHGTGIQINAVSSGVLTNIGTTAKVILTGTDFSGIGDGDNLFENGESIQICETVTVLNCIAASSTFTAYWGCSVNACQSSVSTANVVFPNYIPNLVITPIPSLNSCIGAGNASQQQLKIINTGLGNATNVQLEIFQATGGGYNNNVGSNIDPGSFTYQTGLSGIPLPITPTNLIPTASLACMVSTYGKVTLSGYSINAGDTVYIKWNTYSCCYNACTGVGKSYINGWRYRGNYQSICMGTYVIPEAWGRVYSNIYGALANNGSPSTMIDGQTGTFDFLFSNYGNSYPVGPGAYWKFEFTLPPCLTYSGNLQILRSNGINTWLPFSITPSGNTITAIFTAPPPWSLNQAELKIDLTVDCSSCGGADSLGGVSVKSFYIPNNSCSCEIGVSCQNAPISILCPSPCPEGMVFTYFDLKRTNYGYPDNEPNGGNGIPDGPGSVDLTKIKTNRAMFGDTLTASFNGRVKTSITYPSWQYCFATSSISNGNLLDFVDATLEIYRGGIVIATCTDFSTPGNPVITDSASTKIFRYNLSVPVHPCLTGFTYLNDDSVVFKPRYNVTTNIGNTTPLNCYSSNEYYMSDIDSFPNPPTPEANKFQCANYNGNCTVIGYFFHNWGPESYDTKSCDNVTLLQNYYLSIGPDNNNYAGGNLFPYEYRYWAHIKNLTAIVPSGYTFIPPARFNQVRTAGTLGTNSSGWINLTPTNLNSDTLIFPVEQYFTGFGGTIPLSDDGFYGTLEIPVEPSCKVTPAIYQGIKDDWTFSTTSSLQIPGSDTTFLSKVDDYIVYAPPVLFLQSALPSVFALNTTTSWDISISNTSNVSDALNTWLGGPVISGVTIVQVVDLDSNLIIPLTDSIYHVGTVNAMATRNFRITATFTSCFEDSIIVYSGWNCYAGYPMSVGTYPCIPEKITLTLTPLTPAFLINSTGPASIEMCDTATYTSEGINVQLGTAYNVLFRATLPVGTALVPGSSQFSYPDSASYISISDPVNMGGNTYQWDISAADTLIGINGLKGLLQDSLNSFRVQFKITIIPDCSYITGSSIYYVVQGEAACGLATELDITMSPSLDIIGATAPYNTAIILKTTYVSPCAENSTMKVVVHNIGSVSFGNTDSVVVKLPAGVSFVNGSFSGIYNAPGNGTPVQNILNGESYLKWKLPMGVIGGDSTVFTFDYAGDPLALPCGVIYFEGHTSVVSIITCPGTGNSCITTIATGDTSLAVFTFKAYLSLINGIGTAIPNPPGGETVTIDFDIINTGQAIQTNADSIIQFYYDADGNGIYNTGDVFLKEDTILIPKEDTLHYSTTFDVVAGQACSIIAIVDPAANHCVCDPASLLIQPPLMGSDNDTTMCSGESLTLGSPPVTGYTYSWSPPTGLSDTTAANPGLITSNITTIPVSTTYLLTTNRIGCISSDTITITVNPIPISDAGPDIDVCPGISELIGTLPTLGYTYLWWPTAGLNDSTLSNPSVLLTNPGTYSYIVNTSALGCFSTDTVVVVVNPIPISDAGADILTCSTNIPGNIGTTSTLGYSYLWSPTISLSDSTVSNPTVTLLNPDTTSYIVTTSALGCISKDTVVVTINPLPTATITGTIDVCEGVTAPNITFYGASGTAPYTFTYTLNGGSNQTISTTSGDSVIISAGTNFAGTFVYSLVSVQDASSTACSQPQSGSATVTVNPLPTATITGTSSLCKDTPEPIITFTGAAGTPPYTFTYNINGSTNQTIITTSGNSINISVPTDTAGIFIYNLTGVQDSSSTNCFQSLTESATITVNPLPVANFSFEDVCLNQGMQFNDSSIVAGDTISEWSWSFGDSSPSDTSQNPIYIYISPGTYTVTLISTTNNGCKDTIAKSVVVHPLPTAQFYTTPVSIGICDGTTVQFNDTSTIGAPDILQSWSWNFGDGSALNFNQDTSHIYAVANSYSVQLVVVSNFGCADSISKPITINPNPLVNFSGSPVGGCEPLCVSFSDSSFISGGSNTHWTWDVGDGSPPSNSQNFEQCYSTDSINSPISFSISLTVTSDSGCVSTLTKNNYITVYPNPHADFSVDPEITSVVDPVISFINLSTGTDFWTWDFGDNTTSALSDPSPHTYPADVASYTITLITSNQYGCLDTAYQTIQIDADFTFYIPNAFTPNGDGINDYFFGTGIGIVKYDLWIFDRWGNMIFHGDDVPAKNAKWDGRANGGKEEAQIDVYVWKVALTDVFSNKHKYIGTVTLVK